MEVDETVNYRECSLMFLGRLHQGRSHVELRGFNELEKITYIFLYILHFVPRKTLLLHPPKRRREHKRMKI
jgi:hypothetical protein